MARIEPQAGWVVHRRPWRESSLLIEFFTREYGRLGLVARAARSARSAWRGLAEPFIPLSAGWSRRGEMGTLTALEAAGSRHVLGGRALYCGLYANELLLRLLGRDDPHPEVFDAYGELLLGLSGRAMAQSLLLRRFELALLTGMGVAPDLETDALSGEPIVAGGRYHLQPEAGFAAAPPSTRNAWSGASIQALARGYTDDRDRAREMREIMRTLIDQQLGGRELASRRLLAGAGTHVKGGSSS